MKYFMPFLISIISLNVFAQKKILLDLVVVNEYSKESLSFANVKLVNLNTNQILRKKTNFNGELKLDLQPNMMYTLYANSESDSSIVVFQEKKLKFDTKGIQEGTTIDSQLKVRPYFQKNGLKFLEDISFDIFSYQLDKTAKAKLDNIIELMTKHPEIGVIVMGHASCNLSEDDANSLSGERARSTFSYLTDAGIDYNRITAGAWGKQKPITTCKCQVEVKKDKPCTEKHHLKNSRVSFDFEGI